MTEKKYPFKFTIEFNKNILHHMQAVEILNGLPRREKAEYLAKAILSYEGKLEQVDGLVDTNMMKHLIRQILSEEFKQSSRKETSESVKSDLVLDVSNKSDVENRNPDFIKNLSRSMAAFRGQV